MQDFDLLIIGSGPGGYRAAVLGKLRGLKVAIVEKAQWGGCCLNRGCVPKKDWHHTAQLVAASRDFAKRGIQGSLTADLTTAWRHQKRVVTKVRDSYVDYMKRLGISAFSGEARFIDDHQVSIAGAQVVRAQHIIIATGSSPVVPEPFKLAPDRVLTTDELYDHPPPPGRRVALIGSGVIGTEFAFILTMLGCEIVWLTQSKPLANSLYSPPALKLLYETLAQYGVQARPDSRVLSTQVFENGVTLGLKNGHSEMVDWVLIGAGRRPHSADLNLAAAGVVTDSQGFIKVDAYQQTEAPHIFAIGDVASTRMTANQALAGAAVAVANILAPQSRKSDSNAVPELVYSALELARLGINEEQAEDAGLEPAVGFAAFEANPRALGQDDIQGFMRLIADMDSGALLGAEVVGSEAGELIHLISQEYGKDNALARFAQSFYNHPARAEELQNAAETLAAKWGLADRVFGAA